MTVVLDASALLAYLKDEPGVDVVEAILAESRISSVNWALGDSEIDRSGCCCRGDSG